MKKTTIIIIVLILIAAIISFVYFGGNKDTETLESQDQEYIEETIDLFEESITEITDSVE